MIRSIKNDRKLIIGYLLFLIFAIVISLSFVVEDDSIPKPDSLKKKISSLFHNFAKSKIIHNNVKVVLDLYSYKKNKELEFSMKDTLRAKASFFGKGVDGKLQFWWIAPKGAEEFNYKSKLLSIKKPNILGWSEHKFVEEKRNPIISGSALLKAFGKWRLEVHWIDNSETKAKKEKVLFKVEFNRS